MDLLPLFQAAEETWLGATVRQSLWLFPVIESFHLVAFALLGGSVLMLDLRLVRLLFRAQPVAELARTTRPWLLVSVATMLASGILLFLSEAVKCYYNQPFRIKMIALFLALLFTFTVRRKVAAADEARVGPVWGRFTGLVSMVLWGTVAWAGRWIGFWG
jgi:hypothetical protein